MKFYFYNSYQGSQLGFQMTRLCASGEELQIAGNLDEKIYKAFTAGGIKCILAKAANGNPFFMVRDIRQTDGEGKLWYYNFAAEAENEADYLILCGLVRKFCLENSDFVSIFAKFFRRETLGKISYAADTKNLYDYLCSLNADVPLIGAGIGGRFFGMLRGAEGLLDEAKIGLLVPEAGVEYFRKMHPEYQDCRATYVFSKSDFDKLLQNGIEAFIQKDEPQKTVEPKVIKSAGSTAGKGVPKKKIEINRNQLITAGIVVLGVVAVGVACYLYHRG